MSRKIIQGLTKHTRYANITPVLLVTALKTKSLLLAKFLEDRCALRCTANAISKLVTAQQGKQGGQKMNAETIHAIFDFARFVDVDEDSGIIQVWNGNLTVNVYTSQGDCIDCYTREFKDWREVRDAMWEYLAPEEDTRDYSSLDFGLDSCPTDLASLQNPFKNTVG
tara:strand:+ start:121 stop:621 length:501 start_codon:yes stop_codon:yes gene_type:complete